MNESKYMKIYNDIKTQIETNVIKNKEQLMSENQLCNYYNVSRDTIRKALHLLESDKLVRSQKRKGYICINDPYFSALSKEQSTFIPTNLDSHDLITNKLITFEKIKSNQQLISQYGFKDDEDLYYIFRLRLFENTPIVIDESYFSINYIGELNTDIIKTSIYKHFENIGVDTKHSRKIFKTRIGTDLELEQLMLPTDSQLIEVIKFVYDDEGNIFELSKSIYNPKHFIFVE